MTIKSLIEFFKEYGEWLLVLTMPTLLAISMLIFMYITKPDPEYKTNLNNSNITIHTIDNHEYLVYHHNNAGGMCHKVNCKFCVAKNGKD